MGADLPVVSGQVVPAELTEALQSATDYAAASKSDATRRAYRSDWIDFTAWCEGTGLAAMPCSQATLASYLAQLADRGKRVSTIRRRVAAIAYAHRLKGETSPHDSEAVRAVLAGIRRKVGVAVKRKAPATAQTVQKMTRRGRGENESRVSGSGSPPDGASALGLEGGKRASADLRLLRDRALLLLAFAAALRRSELVGLDVADLEFLEAGVIVHIRASKTDQERAGQQVPVPNGKKLKVVDALRAWLAAAAIDEGPVFRPIAKGGRRIIAARLTDRSVATIVKKYAAAIGLDAAAFSAHSMRAGFVTTALERGVDPLNVGRITRHRDLETLRVYDRRAKLFKDHAGKDFL
jgi:site-specific recombinase XerD